MRGYHIYREIWTTQDGEVLQCKRERSHLSGPFTVAVVRNRTIVVHMPKKRSALCSVFLRSESIECQVMGNKKFSCDIPQGGLEIYTSIYFMENQSRSRKLET